MQWLFYGKESDAKAKVYLTYYLQPPETLLNGGNYIQVEENVPEAENQKGKAAVEYCNPQTGEIWWEYVDRPLTPEEQKMNQLEQAILELSMLMGGAV